MSWASSNSIFLLLRCQAVWNKTCTQLSLSQNLFQNPKNYSLLMFKDSALILDVIRWSFLTNSATATMFTSVRVDFWWPSLSSPSTSSLSSRNWECHLRSFIGSDPHSHKPFAPILVFLSQIDWLWNKILWQLSVHFCHPWRIKKTDLTRQVVTRTLSKMNKRNWVCERMLTDST